MFPDHIQGPLKSIACWTDLLGFGSQLTELGWDLINDEKKLLSHRLLNQISIIQATGSPIEEGLFINDAMTRTLHAEFYSNRKTPSFVLQWLDACISCHCDISQNEYLFGFPGIRTIICEGQVITYKPLFESYARSPFNLPDSFTPQLNTALSKCYYADQLGSKAGIQKNSIYIEESILSHMIEKFDSKYIENYFFPYNHPLLSPVSKYSSIQDLFFFENPDIREDADDAFCRHCWLKLGEKVQVKFNNLLYTLIEIKAYSPIKEFSLFWYDTKFGLPHGISREIFSSEEFLIPKPTYISHNSPEDKLAKELFSLAFQQ